MEELIRRQGRTVLLVSHNIRQVLRIASRAILLDHGRLVSDCSATDAANLYYAQMDKRVISGRTGALKSAPSQQYAKDRFEVESVSIFNEKGQRIDSIGYSDSMRIKIDFLAGADLVSPIFAVGIDSTDLLHIAANRSNECFRGHRIEAGRHSLEFTISRFPLVSGVYSIRFSASDGTLGVERFYGENMINFRVENATTRTDLAGECFLELAGHWKILDNAAKHSASIAAVDIQT
jgi:hypothetical protein